jgi:glutathione S-transferase
MKPTLFYFQGSPNCVVAERAFARKGIAPRAVELPLGIHRGIIRALGFKRSTVPAARMISVVPCTRRPAMRALDALQPEPRLFDGPAVEAAERWGETVAQGVPLRIVSKLIRRSPEHAGTFTPAGAVGKLPPGVIKVVATPAIRFNAWRLRAGGQPELHAALRELPGMLDHVDGLLASGTLSSEEPNAADLQIAPQVRMLMCFDDLRPAVEQRAAVAAWALAVVPDYPGHVPGVLTPEERALLS